MVPSRWADRFGIIIAIGCGVHCAGLSLVFVLYPTLWMKRKYWEMGLWQKLIWLEWSLLATAWLLVLLAMIPGWLQHRRLGPALLALTSLLLMSLVITTSMHFANRWMSLVTLAAGLLLAAAHFWNLRLRPHHKTVSAQPSVGA